MSRINKYEALVQALSQCRVTAGEVGNHALAAQIEGERQQAAIMLRSLRMLAASEDATYA